MRNSDTQPGCPAERLLTVTQVARITGRTENVVRDALQSGALAGHKTGRRGGGRWLIPASALDTWQTWRALP